MSLRKIARAQWRGLSQNARLAIRMGIAKKHNRTINGIKYGFPTSKVIWTMICEDFGVDNRMQKPKTVK